MNETFVVSKKKDDGPTAGRVATGALFGPVHGAVVGKPGHKLRASGYQLAGGVVAGPAGAGAGTYYAHKAGHLKPQKKKVSKRSAESAGSSGSASVGRMAAGTLFSPIHGAVAGRKGKKIEAAGSEALGTLAGSTAGRVVGAGVGAAMKNPLLGARIGAATGGLTGGVMGVKHAQKEGYYKVKKGLDMSVSAFGVEHPVLEDIEKGLAGTRPLAVGAARLGRGFSEAATQFKAKDFSGGVKAFGTQAKKAGQMAGIGVKQMGGQARGGLGNMSFGHKLAVAGGATVAAGGVGAYMGRKNFQKSAFGVQEHSDELSKAENPRQLMTLQRIAGMKVKSVPQAAKNSSKVAEAFKTKSRPTRSAKLAAGQSVDS